MEKDRITFKKNMWRINDIIRHKVTGHPYLVVDLRKYICTFIVDLEDKKSPATPLVLLGRDYDDYAPDWEMALIETPNDKIEKELEFEYYPAVI